MECPSCVNPQTLVSVQAHDGSSCEQCKGVWLPEKALLALSESKNYDLSMFKAQLSLDKRSEESMCCPGCHTFLSRSLVDGIEVDWCDECNGVWFDAGELKKIIVEGGSSSLGDRVSMVLFIGEMLSALAP